VEGGEVWGGRRRGLEWKEMRSGVEEGGGWNERRVANSARFRRGLMDCQPGCDQSDRRC